MNSLTDLRREYASRALDEADAHADPIRQFTRWFEEALESQLLDANAMTLATASAAGEPSARTVARRTSSRCCASSNEDTVYRRASPCATAHPGAPLVAWPARARVPRAH